MIKYKFISFLLAVGLMATCACERLGIAGDSHETVSLLFSSPSIIHSVDSKGAVQGNDFPPSPSAYPLGIWIVRGGTFEEQMTPFRNMKSELSVGADDEIHWNYHVYGDEERYDVIHIMKARSADVYAYYPWNDEVEDVRVVPFISGQDDWMWASPINLTEDETNTDSQITKSLEFTHAMTCIEVNIRCLYRGNVRLTSMTLTDNAAEPRLIPGGTMNTVNGELTNDSPVKSSMISPDVYLTHQASGTSFYIIMPSVGNDSEPLDLENKPMELSFVFNGINGKTTFPIPSEMGGAELKSFKRGYKYVFQLVLDNKMDFKPVGVESEWGTIYQDFEL